MSNINHPRRSLRIAAKRSLQPVSPPKLRIKRKQNSKDKGSQEEISIRLLPEGDSVVKSEIEIEDVKIVVPDINSVAAETEQSYPSLTSSGQVAGSGVTTITGPVLGQAFTMPLHEFDATDGPTLEDYELVTMLEKEEDDNADNDQEPARSLLSPESAEVLNRMRERADKMKNNTNIFLSAKTEENYLRIRPTPRHPPHVMDGSKECNRDKEASSSSQNPAGGCSVVTNPKSISLPNLACSDINNTLELAATTGFLENFADMTRSRSLGPSGGEHIAPNSNSSSNPLGLNAASSVVKLALSSNFPGALLSTAQSYPSLTSSGQVAGSGVTTTTGPVLGQAFTMSFASKSSDSEQSASSLLSLEEHEVLDRMREGAERIKNNTNSVMIGEIVGFVPVRISVAVETEENSLRIRPIPRHTPHMMDKSKECSRDKEASSSSQNPAGGCFVVTNPNSISLPNLACSDINNTLELAAATGFVENFADMTRSQSLGPAGGEQIAPNSNSGSNPRGPNASSSVVKLALSSTFPGALLSKAQSYPSMTSSGQVVGSGVTSTAGPRLGQAFTMSSASKSSDSEQVRLDDNLESCGGVAGSSVSGGRTTGGPTLLTELEDDEDPILPEEDGDNEDNDQEPARSLLSPESAEGLNRMRERADNMKNNTNISLSAETEENYLRIRLTPRHPPHVMDGSKECNRDKEASSSSQNPAGGCSVVTNPNSISLPNLACSDINNTLELAAATGFLENFADMTRSRSLGPAGGEHNAPNSNSGSNPRGPNAASSVVKLALSSTFPGALLSKAQSYPSMTSSGQVVGSGVTSTAGPRLGQAFTMSSASKSSDSEQDSNSSRKISFFTRTEYRPDDNLESCGGVAGSSVSGGRTTGGPTHLTELEDDEVTILEKEEDDNADNDQEPSRSLLSPETAEVLNRMGVGADKMKNNTNSSLSGEVVGFVPAETEENYLRIRATPRHPPHVMDESKECSRDKEASSSSQNPAGGCSVVTNPKSVSVPNLACSDINNTLELAAATGFVENFADMTRSRSLGPAGGEHNAPNSNSGSNPRGPNAASSVVKLALSSNFPGALLSTAQSYPSLTSSGQVAGSGVTTTTGPVLGQAFTMSFASESSDSEQVRLDDNLESCGGVAGSSVSGGRTTGGPALLTELEDDEDPILPEEDGDNEDNDQEPARSLLSPETAEAAESKECSRDKEASSSSQNPAGGCNQSSAKNKGKNLSSHGNFMGHTRPIARNALLPSPPPFLQNGLLPTPSIPPHIIRPQGPICMFKGQLDVFGRPILSNVWLPFGSPFPSGPH